VASEFKIAPSVVRSWGLSDVMLVQRFWSHQRKRQAEAVSRDSPENMALMFGD
jgi:hypothetical protein